MSSPSSTVTAWMLAVMVVAGAATRGAAAEKPPAPRDPGFSIRSQGVGLCVRTPKDGLKVLEVRVAQPSDDPDRDRRVRAEFLGQTLPSQFERNWIEWLALWVGVPETVQDGRTVGTLVGFS